MKRWGIAGSVAFVSTFILFAGTMVEGQEEPGRKAPWAPVPSTVKIIHPQKGETIPLSKEGAEVMVMYELIKGNMDKGDHVHVFLNDQERGINKHPPKVFRFMQPGKYTVKLRIATKGHQMLAHEHEEVPEDTVEFEVVAAP